MVLPELLHAGTRRYPFRTILLLAAVEDWLVQRLREEIVVERARLDVNGQHVWGASNWAGLLVLLAAAVRGMGPRL